jgi:hypothetical protein
MHDRVSFPKAAPDTHAVIRELTVINLWHPIAVGLNWLLPRAA